MPNRVISNVCKIALEHSLQGFLGIKLIKWKSTSKDIKEYTFFEPRLLFSKNKKPSYPPRLLHPPPLLDLQKGLWQKTASEFHFKPSKTIGTLFFPHIDLTIFFFLFTE